MLHPVALGRKELRDQAPVTACPGEEVAAALEAAAQARLLVDEEHGYRFAHDVIRARIRLGSHPLLPRYREGWGRLPSDQPGLAA